MGKQLYEVTYRVTLAAETENEAANRAFEKVKAQASLYLQSVRLASETESVPEEGSPIGR